MADLAFRREKHHRHEPVNEPGIALFVSQGADKIAHIGITIGGCLAVDCRGSAYGVLLGPVSSHHWTHWARFADVDYRAARLDLPAVMPGVVACKNGSLNLRSRPDTKTQVLTKLAKGKPFRFIRMARPRLIGSRSTMPVA